MNDFFIPAYVQECLCNRIYCLIIASRELSLDVMLHKSAA